jgi:hypothetical protein
MPVLTLPISPRSRRSSLEIIVIVSSSIAALFIITAGLVMQPTGASKQKWKSIRKTNVVGFFAQDLADTDDVAFDYVREVIVLLWGLLVTFRGLIRS